MPEMRPWLLFGIGAGLLLASACTTGPGPDPLRSPRVESTSRTTAESSTSERTKSGHAARQAESVEAQQAEELEAQQPGSKLGGSDGRRNDPPLYALNGALDLDAVLKLSEERSLHIALAEEAHREAQAEQELAAYSAFPRVGIRAGYQRVDGRVQPVDGRFIDVLRQQSYAVAGLSLTVRPGQAVFAAGAASERARGANFMIEAARLEARFRSAAPFFALQRANAELRIAQNALAHAQALEEWTGSRVERGAALESEWSRARAHRAAVENRITQAQEAAKGASFQLARSLRLQAEHPIAVEGLHDPFRSRTPEELGRATEDLVREAIERRPDLRAAGFEIAAAEEEREGAEFGWAIPNLHLEASRGGIGGTFAGLNDVTTYTAEVQWEVGFDQFARADRAQARMRRASLQRTLLLDAIRAEVGAAQVALESAGSRRKAAQLELEAARDLVEVADTRFRQGAGLLLEVLDARAALAAAESHWEQALVDAAEAELALRLALGRR